jgi:hypothetical protein
LNIEGKVGIHNKFEIEKVNTQTGEVENYEAYNMIVDAMWTRLCARNTYFNTIVFGSGTGTLAVNRTTLFTAMGNKAVTHVSRNYVETASTPISWKQKIVLLPEEYQSTSITEVGIGHTTTSIVTHALIKDSESNPIAVTKGEFDQITIYATIYVTLGEISYGNTKWWGFQREESVRYSSNLLVLYLLGQGTTLNGGYRVSNNLALGSSGVLSSAATLTADAPNKKILFSTVRYGTTNANLTGGIKTVGYGVATLSSITRLFASNIPATSVFTQFDIEGEQIGVGDGAETDFSLDFPDIIDESDIVYVDSVVKTRGTDYSVVDIEGSINTLDKLSISSGLSNTGNGVSFSPDGKYLAFAHNGGQFATVYNFDSDNGIVGDKLTIASGLDSTGYGVSFSSDGKYLAFAHNIGQFATVYNFDSTNGIVGNKLTIASGLDNTGRGVAFSPDGKYLACAHDSGQRVTIYNFDSTNGIVGNKLTIASGLDNTGYGVSFSPDGKYLACGHNSGQCTTTYSFYVNPITETQIQFTTPPALDAVITADYSVDYIPKDANHVLDVGFSIQFADGNV